MDKMTPELRSAIRAWAKLRGYSVPEKGRIPKAIADLYQAAQPPTEPR